MKEKEILSTIQTLARSQGAYGRMLERLDYLREAEPESYRDVMAELEAQQFASPVDLVMYMEG